jgi:hypothetical protein
MSDTKASEYIPLIRSDKEREFPRGVSTINFPLLLCNINLFAIEAAQFMALFPHYPDSSTSSLSLSEVEGSMSFCGLKPTGVGEFFTSSPRPKGRGNKL